MIIEYFLSDSKQRCLFLIHLEVNKLASVIFTCIVFHFMVKVLWLFRPEISIPSFPVFLGVAYTTEFASISSYLSFFPPSFVYVGLFLFVLTVLSVLTWYLNFEYGRVLQPLTVYRYFMSTDCIAYVFFFFWLSKISSHIQSWWWYNFLECQLSFFKNIKVTFYFFCYWSPCPYA